MLRLVVFAICCVGASATTLPVIRPGSAVSGPLLVGEARAYSFVVPAASAARLEISQIGLDLRVAVRCGLSVQTVDSFEDGPEILAISVDTRSACSLRVTAAPGASGRGRFVVRLSIHPVNASDEPRMQASAASTEAKRLRREKTTESAERAIESARKGYELWLLAGERAAAARSLTVHGDLLSDLNQHANALDTYLAARDLAASAGDVEAEMEALNNAGLAAWKIGSLQSSKRMLADAYDTWNAMASPNRAAAALNYGLLCQQTGDYSQALQLLLRARDLFHERMHLRGVAFAQNNLALVYLALQEPAQAAASLREAISALALLGDRAGEARSRVNLGHILLGTGQPRSALQTLTRALLDVQGNLDERAIADVELNLGRARIATGSEENGTELLNRALQRFRKLGDPRGEAFAIHQLGMAHFGKGDWVESARCLTEARDIRLRHGMFDAATESLFELARVQRANGEMDRAVNTLESVLTESESVRDRVSGESLRSAYMAGKQPYYDELIGVLWQLGRENRALEIVERARARSLLDLLGTEVRAARKGAEPSLLAEEESLLVKLRNKAEAARSSASPFVQSELDELVTAYDLVESKIRSSPSGALGQMEPLPPDRISKLLDPDTILLEYRLGAERSFLWAVTNRSVRAYALPPTRTLERQAQEFLRLATDPESRRADATLQRRFRGLQSELSGILLGPVRGRLAGVKLLIAPDSILHYLPFPLLVEGAAEITIVPSGSVLARSTARTSYSNSSVLAAAADPVFEPGDSRFRRLGVAAPSGQTFETGLRLPFSRSEVLAAAHELGAGQAHIATGFDASKQWLHSDDVQNARIVHFATHAQIEPRQPALSRILLSRLDRNGKIVDGDLRASEIINLDLRAELVVISACRSGSGPELRGEGMLSLSQAFLYAGVPYVVANLWDTEDQSTGILMRAFYKKLFESEEFHPAAALAAAQAEMRRIGFDPYYWAGFRLVASAR